MRFFYFILKKMMLRFILFFFLITSIFTVGNLFSRPLPFIGIILGFKLIWFIFLVMATYTMPFAVALSGYMLIADFIEHDEHISLYYFVSMQQTVRTVLLVFSCLIAGLYFWLLFSLAPLAYQHSKRLLVGAVYEYIENVPVNMMQKVSSNAVVFCAEKDFVEKKPVYKSLFFANNEKNNKMFACLADTAYLKDNKFSCINGSILVIQPQNIYGLQFEEANFSLGMLMQGVGTIEKKTPERFASGLMLLQKYDHDAMRKELYKRLGQLWWLFFLPCLAALFSTVDMSKKNRFVRGIAVSGIFFILSYAFITTSYAMGGSLLSFLGTSVLGSLVCLYLYNFLK